MIMHRIQIAAAVVLCLLTGAPHGPGFAADTFPEASRLYNQGKKAEALNRLNAHLEQQPKDARARFLKGVILADQNKVQEAITVFSLLTEDYPELPEPYNNLAVLYANSGEYDKARNALEMAIRTHPTYAVAHENLGDIYATLASQAYDKALQFDSGNAGARKKLAMIKELVPARPAAPAVPGGPKQPSVSATPVPAPAPAAPPAQPARQAPPQTASAAAAQPGQAQSVLDMLQAWTQAWSNNDVDGYLAFYAPDFKTPGGETRAQWEASRRARIAKPKKIDVTASSPRVEFTDNTHATVTFRQNYSSDSLTAAGNKTLHLVRTGSRWLIQQESIDK